MTTLSTNNLPATSDVSRVADKIESLFAYQDDLRFLMNFKQHLISGAACKQFLTNWWFRSQVLKIIEYID